MANLITSIRIICSVVLLFCKPLSTTFYAVYLLAGFSDMIDGFVARKTGTSSEFGAKLDTVADFAMVAVCSIKLLPVINVKTWMYIWAGSILLLKTTNIIAGFFLEKRLVCVHSVANKVAGASLFVLPLSLEFIKLDYSAGFACVVATIATLQEVHHILTKENSCQKN